MKFELSAETIAKYRKCQEAIKIASEKMVNGIASKVRRSAKEQRDIVLAQRSARLLKTSLPLSRKLRSLPYGFIHPSEVPTNKITCSPYPKRDKK